MNFKMFAFSYCRKKEFQLRQVYSQQSHLPKKPFNSVIVKNPGYDSDYKNLWTK